MRRSLSSVAAVFACAVAASIAVAGPAELSNGLIVSSLTSSTGSEWLAPRWNSPVESPASPYGTEAEAGPDLGSATPSAYPNPCGAAGADVQFVLSRCGSVTAAIYSAGGALVRTLAADRVERRGICQLQWNGKDNSGRSVVAGTYLCRISAGDVRSVVSITKSR